MKFNANSDSNSPNASSNAASNSSAVPAASVPIPVYRELAAELQATRVMLESTHTKNQQLAQQNQQLRQEIERVVQLGLNLRHWVEPAAEPASSARTAASPDSVAEAAALAEPLRRGVAPKSRDPQLISDQLFTEEALPPSRAESKPPRDFSGLWLTLTILFIIATAFGAGFLVMKPFLSNR